MNITRKIISAHLVSGKMNIGEEVGLKIDRTLTQDATGTMAYLQFEAMGVPKVKTELSVSYINHNTLQNGFENADDHRYLQSADSEIRCNIFSGRQRYMSPAAPGAFRHTRQNAYRFRLAHANRRRNRHACVRCGRA